jgi:hypothetical protein
LWDLACSSLYTATQVKQESAKSAYIHTNRQGQYTTIGSLQKR